MKVIRHGKYYRKNIDKIMICKTCGCKFSYNRDDITYIYGRNFVNIALYIVKKTVSCPKCLGTMEVEIG